MEMSTAWPRYVLGGPSLVSDWGFDVVAHLVDAVAPRWSMTWVDRGDDVARLVSGMPASSPVFCSQFPSASLVDVVATHPGPVLVFADDPVDMVVYQWRRHGGAPAQAMRTVSAGLSASRVLQSTDGAAWVHRSLASPIGGIVAGMAKHLDFEVSDARLADIIRRMSSADDPSGARSLETTLASRPHYAPSFTTSAAPALPAEFAPIDAPTITAALPALLKPPAPGDISYTWSHAVFLQGDHPDTLLPAEIDLTGPARVVIYGPYLHLPPARYRVELALEPSAYAVPLLMSVEFHAGGTCLRRVLLEFVKAGPQAASITIDHQDPGAGIEMRVRCEHGVLEGSLTMLGATFTELSVGALTGSA
jgi:hypothetical protein